MSLLDFLFPKQCLGCKQFGLYVCPSCFAKISFLDFTVCAVCQRQTIDGLTHPRCYKRNSIDGVFASLVYKGLVKKLLYSFKYPPYITDLKTVLTDLFYEGIIQKEMCALRLQKPTIFVPIPLHITRQRTRGYNQSAILATEMAKRFGGEMEDCLERINPTKTQVGLTKEERAENIRGAFALRKMFLGILNADRQYFLVDDVATSGATMREAAKVLKINGAGKVYGITLAHGE